MLCLDTEHIKNKSEEQTIENIIKEMKINYNCYNCKSSTYSRIQFNSFPKILIIIFEKNINLNLNMKVN